VSLLFLDFTIAPASPAQPIRFTDPVELSILLRQLAL
jgi:hypothetical protein